MNNTPRYPQRVRNDLRFRELTVLRVERISAGFQRIVLGGEALDGFTSRGFDDHTNSLFLNPTGRLCAANGNGRRASSGRKDHAHRRVTIRRCMTIVATVTAIDFFIHDGGVASGWAMQAQPGDKLTAGRSARFAGGAGRLRVSAVCLR
ncbi:siderophore-interacting protein [Escherichia coli]